jgi:hypothetical protein
MLGNTVILSVGRQQLAGVFAFRASARRNAAQSIPSFSTTSKHATHRNASNSIAFMGLLTTLWIPGGRGPL